MKKFVSLFSLVLLLHLLLPVEQALADRGSGRGGSSGGSWGSGRSFQGGHSGKGGAPRGFQGHRGFPRKDFHGYRFSPHGHTHFRWYPGYGAFLPGLIIGGVLGWTLTPRYYTPPPYYALPPDYVYPPPPEGGPLPQGSGQLSIYPREGQSQEQQDRDHVECHDWAVGQAGFDPFVPPPTDRTEAERAQRSAHYLQALESCLDVRGYTLK